MGSGSFNSTMYRTYASTATTRVDGTRKTVQEVFTQRSIHKSLDPKNIKMRESCDSEDSPESHAIIIGLDVTGSMGMIADSIVETQLGDLIEGILDDKTIKYPHIMFMAIGDIAHDTAPLQVSQFEADNRIVQQLSDIYVEGRGGGNDTESYDLPWYFAATRTKIDCFDKRNKKGYLFTIGDEMVPNGITPTQMDKLFGMRDQVKYTADELYHMAKEKYDVFHIIVEEGSYARRNVRKVYDSWYKLIGKRAVLLSDYKKLADVILAIMRVNEGEDPDSVIDTYQDEYTRKVVTHAIYGLEQQ